MSSHFQLTLCTLLSVISSESSADLRFLDDTRDNDTSRFSSKTLDVVKPVFGKSKSKSGLSKQGTVSAGTSSTSVGFSALCCSVCSCTSISFSPVKVPPMTSVCDSSESTLSSRALLWPLIGTITAPDRISLLSEASWACRSSLCWASRFSS